MSNNLQYRRKKRANYRRNQRWKARLIAGGLTDEQARQVILEAGRMVEEASRRRDQRDRQALRRALGDLPPVQPPVARSVRAITAGLPDSNRRRH